MSYKTLAKTTPKPVDPPPGDTLRAPIPGLLTPREALQDGEYQLQSYVAPPGNFFGEGWQNVELPGLHTLEVVEAQMADLKVGSTQPLRIVDHEGNYHSGDQTP